MEVLCKAMFASIEAFGLHSCMLLGWQLVDGWTSQNQNVCVRLQELESHCPIA